MKTSFARMALLTVLIIGSALFVPAHRASAADTSNDLTVEEFTYMVKRNGAFLEAARRIVEESGKDAPRNYLETAEKLSREATEHFKAGEKALARLDVLDSTRLVILAITLSKIDSQSIRDIVIEEELAMKEMRDMAMKESIIGRRITEVEVFIQTAERLVRKSDVEIDPEVMDGIEAARASLEKARAELKKGAPNAAFTDINTAYDLAVGSVKRIKRSSEEVITFPPPPSGDMLALYEYELKRNNTHMFFANEVVAKSDTEAKDIVRKSRKLRDEAMKLKESGDVRAATDMLLESTGLLTRAIRLSVSSED